MGVLAHSRFAIVYSYLNFCSYMEKHKHRYSICVSIMYIFTEFERIYTIHPPHSHTSVGPLFFMLSSMLHTGQR